jgi:RNA polymerase sigma factor (sigma-70 family)
MPDCRHTDTHGRLVRAAVAGDERAWDALYRRFTPAVRGVARGYRLSPADVDDVVQNTWLAAATRIDRLREPEAIGAWLITTARREALQTLQRGGRELASEEVEAVAASGAAPAESPLLDGERRDALHAAVKRLPRGQRAVLGELLRTPGASYAEVARRLRRPLGSIGPTRDRGITRLRRDRALAAWVAEASA